MFKKRLSLSMVSKAADKSSKTSIAALPLPIVVTILLKLLDAGKLLTNMCYHVGTN